MIFSPPSVSYEAVTDFGITGLVGTLTYALTDNLNNYAIAPTAAGITEFPAGSGIYYITQTAPAFEGQYTSIWDDGAGHSAIDDLTITSDAPIMVIGSPGSALGPLSGWLTGEDVAACCSVETTDSSIFDDAAQIAQELLFQLSGRIFPGIGVRSVRPCATDCACGWQVLSRGHIVWSDSWHGDWQGWWCNDMPCGCWPLSRVKLAGYPVQTVTAVKIDGAAVDPATYRLDNHRWLTRVRDPADPDTVLHWPSCQNLDLPDTEDGTFSVSYTYGQNPPQIGIDAAAQLACELYKECAGEACALPKGTTQVSRQGVTINKPAFAAWAFQEGRVAGMGRGWHTGMPLVDAFLNAFNPAALKRRPTVWAPSMTRRYAPSVGP